MLCSPPPCAVMVTMYDFLQFNLIQSNTRVLLNLMHPRILSNWRFAKTSTVNICYEPYFYI